MEADPIPASSSSKTQNGDLNENLVKIQDVAVEIMNAEINNDENKNNEINNDTVKNDEINNDENKNDEINNDENKNDEIKNVELQSLPSS